MQYVPDHPGIAVVVHHSVVKIKHHQSLHFSPKERTKMFLIFFVQIRTVEYVQS